MSLTVRDKLPTVAEAKAYANGEKELATYINEWMETTEHQNRVSRFLEGFFGIEKNAVTDGGPSQWIQQNEHGVYYVNPQDTNDCGSTGVTSEAWWLEAGQTVQVCENLANKPFWTEATNFGNYQSCTPQDTFNRGCGCGPKLIFCTPRNEYVWYTVRDDEWSDRGVYVYNNNLSWHDYFAGRWIYGDKRLAYIYLMSDFFWRNEPTRDAPPIDMTEEISIIQNLEYNTKVRIDLDRPYRERHGAATGGYMFRRAQTFRSRVRLLVKQLLCQELAPSLNLARITTFVNEDTRSEVESHGSTPGCEGCHYVLDNMTSLFANYFQNSFAAHAFRERRSNLGHALGADGNGPGFFMDQVLAHSDFMPCMAKKAWEDFAGTPYELLSTEERANFETVGNAGPRSLIRAILTSPQILSLRR